MAEFFAICEYFEITPVEFFSKEISNPTENRQLLRDIEQLKETDITLVHGIVKRLIDQE